MRTLTKKQKQILDKALEINPEAFGISDLPVEVMDELEEINDTEILWQEANRYIRDRKCYD